MAETNSSQLNTVTGMLTLNELRERIKNGDITQVTMSFPDMYGRLMGKTIDGEFFLESTVHHGTHCSDHLFMCGMDMQRDLRYNCDAFELRFSDILLMPDMKSLRLLSWKDKTANVMCDIYSNNELLTIAPRTLVQQQLAALEKLSYKVLSASELEYYTFENSYRHACQVNYDPLKMKRTADHFTDYQLLQAAHEEKYTALFRHHLKASGVPIESSELEGGKGQHELNVKYCDVLSMADRHVTYKQCLKEIADQLNMSITFMAKPFPDEIGSGCHVHLSLINSIDGKNVFVGDETIPGANFKCSSLFKSFLAGLMKYTPDMMVFYAPTINSYKRLTPKSYAPTNVSWSHDNRTATYRVLGKGQSLRIEFRLPGADCNIYLVFTAVLASGLRGIQDQLSLPPICDGNAYETQNLPQIPRTLTEAIDLFEKSKFARETFGDHIVNHYTIFYRNEQDAYEKAVTDWEKHRYFQQI
ncbi:hypothetical protein I4U23_011641 [Adineta vaga]|nr:hypothetical protein I4U23_011641 [Adineta vaga]